MGLVQMPQPSQPSCVHRHCGTGEGGKRGERNGLLWQQFTTHSGMREGVLTREIYPLWGIKIRCLILAMRPFLCLEVLTQGL